MWLSRIKLTEYAGLGLEEIRVLRVPVPVHSAVTEYVRLGS